MQALKLVAVGALALSAPVAAELKPGSCPSRGQNKPKESFNPYSMAGLWYEYVWDQGFAMGLDYTCGTWIVLSDEAEQGENMFLVYNNMLRDEPEHNT